MAAKHISDDQVQEYLDSQVSRQNSLVALHLNDCETCQKKLIQYQTLYAVLNEDVNFSLSPNFSESIIARLQEVTSGAFKIQLWHILVAVFALMIGVGAAFYFVGIKTLMGLQAQFGSTVHKFIDSEVFSTMVKFLSNLHMNISLLGFAILIVLIMSAIDRFIFQSKHKLISIFR